ncbi:hypothetical protein WJX74_003639 [Apatococcus lobatus]|uniref:Cytochrome b561 domain-containing protein n=1 Tax=Apatococcus lobatus TaxID=904363 RepID=A0AAW1RSB3_9CHLO
MANPRSWSWQGSLFLLALHQQFFSTQAHVQLLYPQALSPNDYLTSLHTAGLCGEERTGYDFSLIWRNWIFLNRNATSLQSGTSSNVTWSSVNDHVGGWKLELWDQTFQLAYAWDNSSHWGCDADGTARWANIQLPSQPCANCTLRLLRQALDKSLGDNFTYASCSAVNIVTSAVDCNGCSGHGSCVQGACQCDNSRAAGFWEGTHCERENECQADADCGQYGRCIDMGEDIAYPPRFQCHCQNGYFGPANVTASGRLPVRTCSRRSALAAASSNDARGWAAFYSNQSFSNPNNTYTVFWKIENGTTTPYIEYAIWANTSSWVGLGLRPTANRSQANTQPTYTDANPWTLPAPRATVLNNRSSSGCPYRPVGTPVDPAANDQGRPGSSAPPPYAATWTPVAPAPVGERVSSYLADGQVTWQQSSAGEGFQQLYGQRTGFMLNDSSLNTTEVPGQCRALVTNFNDAPPMINQDIVVTSALPTGYYRILDYFTPNLARPRPDVVYNGTDDILDATATEENGVTYIKFRKPLQSNDSAADYCLSPGINYQMIWAMGQMDQNISRSPPAASTPTPPPFRGTLGNVDLFTPSQSLVQGPACAPSPIQGMQCSATIIPGEYTIHWTPKADGVNITCLASGSGFVGLGWPAKQGQMLGAHAIIGWVNTDATQNIQVYELVNKTAAGIVPANTFTPQNQLVAPNQANGNQMMLQFFRAYDATFQQGKVQSMIASYHNSHNYLDHHTNRRPFTIDFSSTASLSTKPKGGVTHRSALAHAVLMWISFAVIFPAGVIMARYFKDLTRQWHIAHAIIQTCGIIMVIGSFGLAMSRFTDPSKHHYHIGISAFALVIAQPFSSVPRLCLHHGEVLRNPFFAWLHWSLGRFAIILGWVNIFFGFGEYRRIFPGQLGSWPQVAFGLYLGALVTVCLVLESRLYQQSAVKQLQREDDLSRRIAALSAQVAQGIGGHKPQAQDSEDEDDIIMETHPRQSRDPLFNYPQSSQGGDVVEESGISSHMHTPSTGGLSHRLSHLEP